MCAAPRQSAAPFRAEGLEARAGLYGSVKKLTAKIDQFVSAYNKEAKPFIWVATPDSILAKIERLCERISGTGH